MASAVHHHHGLWIAPAAPGFDAREIGGTTVVPRDGGRTLLRGVRGRAMSSNPDALGLISWNEFSENTYIEPSKKYGSRYLDVAARCRPGTSGLPERRVGLPLRHRLERTRPRVPNRSRSSYRSCSPVMAAAVVVGVRRRRQGPRRPDPNAASSNTTS